MQDHREWLFLIDATERRNAMSVTHEALCRGIVIGASADADLAVSDTSLAGRHCRIHMQGGSMFAVQDLRSSSGVFVAGTRLIAMDVVTLPENNAFQCGSVAFRVLDERSAWMHDRGDPRVDTFLSESLRFRKTLTENDRIRDYLDTRIQNLGGSGGGKLGGESGALPLTYSEQKPKTVAPPGTRFLDLSRIPPDAELIVNGQVVRTRGIVAVPIGEHDVLIEQGLLRRRHKKIVVTEGEEPFELR